MKHCILPALLLTFIPCLRAETPESARPYKAFKADGKISTAYAVQYRNSLCIVASRDTSAGGKNTRFSDEAGEKLASKPKIFQLPRTSVFIHPGKKSGDALPYDAAFRLKAGHRLVAIHPDGRRDEGTLLFSAATADAYTTTMGSITLAVLTRTKEYQDRLPAGCPVLDTQTGRVVGTLVTNWSSRKPYEPYQASDHYFFEPLCLPLTQKTPRQRASSLAGIAFTKPCFRDEFRWLLPTAIWDYDVTAKAGEEFVTGTRHFEERGHSVSERV